MNISDLWLLSKKVTKETRYVADIPCHEESHHTKYKLDKHSEWKVIYMFIRYHGNQFTIATR